ncbi:sensor histidine kinase [Marinifilum caeruleilacunae]|uniref:Signal transduction histidine kinase internal region domain-containing protein n=1 Tax=Marinifilum caeruleilacunae TaxID=2499076 RepID=A0ABX1WXQ8_9BACT|nr:sensor histidine kinase [Marinifilum caeruleilacunae]NOU60877.1 hypothetical protein [Marinifilum caeruleilacunae]
MNLKIKQQIIFLLLLFPAFNLFAGFSQTDGFTQVDGLPCNCVNHIFEDSRGLIWLATDAGLCEFNGYEVGFRKELNRLQGEKVTSLAEDAKGNLIITASGVGVCEFDGEKLEVLTNLIENTPIEIRSVSKHNNSIFIGASNGVFVRDTAKHAVKFLQLSGSENLNVSSTMVQDDNLIVFPKFKLGSSKYQSEQIVSTKHHKRKVLQLNTKFRQNILVGEQVILKGDGENIICDVINRLTNKNELFVLLRYFKNNQEHRKLISIKDELCVDYLEENNLHDVFVQSLFKHKLTKDVWLGTKNHGLIRLKQSIFTLYKLEDLLPEIGNVVDFVSLLDGSVFLAGNGIGKVVDGRVQEMIPIQQFQNLLPKNSKDRDIIFNDIEKNGDVLWIATNHGFFTLDGNTFRLEYKGISKAIKFIVLSNNRLFYYDGSRFVTTGMNSGKTKIHMKHTERDELEITKMIEFDSKVWVSTENQGIYRFDEDSVYEYGRKNCGIHNVVNDMLILPDSSIIAGGNNGILYKLKSQGNKLIIKDSIDNSDGLEGISVHGFQYLSDGSIWCGTNLGVHRFDYSTWHPDSVLRYRFWNASKDVEFRGKESLIDRYGNIWVNSNHTLMKINADDYDVDNTSYQPSLLGVKIKQNHWKSKKSEVNKWTSIPKNPIHLNHRENYVSFTFGMLYCDNLENIKYRYRLLGLDDDWSEWKTTNEVVYSNLKGGDYKFQLEARKLSSDQVSTYAIDVILDTAWWKTIWFWVIVLCILTVAIYYGIKYYKSRIRFEEKQRTKQFNRVIGLKIKALQYQLDPHFIFNSLNSIQSYILDEEEDKALEYLSDFSMVLRNNIDNANKNMIGLHEELAYLKLYLKLEQMRFEEKFSFQINVDENINPRDIQIPPMIIQPFLEHAIRYGIGKLEATGKLIIRFVLEEDGYLRCVITDNGKGNRKVDIKNTESDFIAGNSLQTTCDRMKLLNKVLSNGRTYSYKINEFIDSKTNFSGVITEIGFPKL